MVSRHSNTMGSTRAHRMRRAFTLIEILVVVTIIALLAGAVAWKVMGALGRSKQSIAKQSAVTLANALDNWRLDTGNMVEDGLDLRVLLLGPDEGGGSGGPYLRKRGEEQLNDPWGRRFMVRVPGEVNVDFDVYSFGGDGQPGGTGENADVAN